MTQLAPTVAASPHAITYPWGDALPATGTHLNLRRGLHWVRMPMPFALNHINLWVLDDHDTDGEAWTAGRSWMLAWPRPPSARPGKRCGRDLWPAGR